MNLFERTSKKLLESASQDAAWQMLGILESPDFVKQKSKLEDALPDGEWKKIEQLMTALYNELKKHEVGDNLGPQTPWAEL